MRRYHITVGAKTSVGGIVKTGSQDSSIAGQPIARERDLVSCPVCRSDGVIVLAGRHLVELYEDREAALEGDVCLCKCTPPPTLIANQTLKWQEIRVDQRVTSTAPITPPDTCVFAKSCVSVPPGSIAAGTAPEPANNFGAMALLASTGTAGTVGRVAGTLGSDLGAWAVRGLAGVAAGASSALNVMLLAFWPRDIGDSTLYSPEGAGNADYSLPRA
ncbi:PAAR domain-containing protein [Pseudomonas gingeri]|uniref:PAAR domain-containing protein n=3 Tax=Pseudomonas gingeri TaxID=117681 RepID=UPI001C42EFFF